MGEALLSEQITFLREAASRRQGTMFRRSKHWLTLGVLSAGALGFAGMAAAAGAPPNGAGPYDAQHPMTMNDVGFTGPLEAPNARTVPKGAWILEPYLTYNIDYGKYNHGGSFSSTPNTNMFLSATLIQYGVTNRFNVSLIPTFWAANISGGLPPQLGGPSGASNGLRMGDMTLRGQYNLIPFQHVNDLTPITSVAVAEHMPTGSYDGLNTMADGLANSGIWSTDIGLWTENYWSLPNGHMARSRFTVDYSFPDSSSSVNGISALGGGTTRNFTGTANGSNTLTVDASFEYALTTTWIPVIEAVYKYTNGGKVAGYNVNSFTSSGLPDFSTATPVLAYNGSSQVLEVDPAIEFMFNQNIGLIVGVQASVWGSNTSAYVVPQAALDMFFM
ncbi:MAG TPA: hypothetical protein VF265_10365 [Nevskiaceae bacterium]